MATPSTRDGRKRRRSIFDKSRRSFGQSLFLSIGSTFLLFAICFSVFQYNREKNFKINILQSRLQMFNVQMIHELGDSICSRNAFDKYMRNNRIEGLRVTLIDAGGHVLMDSERRDVSHMTNHLNRKEIREARRNGEGYDIKRASESLHTTFFYAATYIQPRIAVGYNPPAYIRCALPYSSKLTQTLDANDMYILFAVSLVTVLGLVLYLNTRRIGRHVTCLRQFALQAESGQVPDTELERKLPDDELGDISHTIITLFWKLHHAEEERNRIKQQLTQNAAHELKTPTASIHGYLESILSNPDMPADKRQHFLERCYAQSQRMVELLQDISTLNKLSKPDAPRDIKHDPTDVRCIISNVLEDVGIQLDELGIQVVKHLPESIIVDGDASYIYSIFRNIMDNVLSYAVGADRVVITCHKYCSHFEFTIADNGPGIPPEHLGKVFERFYRIDKGRSRKIGGTGLGMAIVKNAVAAHGGTCSAEVTPGGGLTIRFTLRAAGNEQA